MREVLSITSCHRHNCGNRGCGIQRSHQHSRLRQRVYQIGLKPIDSLAHRQLQVRRIEPGDEGEQH